MEQIVESFAHLICYTGLHIFTRSTELFEYTRDELDMEVLHNISKLTKQTRNLMFFWKPDLERVVDLVGCAQMQIQRIKAAKVLTARIRLISVGLAMGLICSKENRMKPICEMGRYAVEKARRIEWSHCKKIQYDWLVGGPCDTSWIMRQESVRNFNLNDLSRRNRIKDKMVINESLPLLGFDETTVRTILQQLNLKWSDIKDNNEWTSWLEKHQLRRHPVNNTFATQVYSKKSLLENGPLAVKQLAGVPI